MVSPHSEQANRETATCLCVYLNGRPSSIALESIRYHLTAKTLACETSTYLLVYLTRGTWDSVTESG
jgi:hypothetical protein